MIGALFFRVFEHLLPRALSFLMKEDDNPTRKLFKGLEGGPEDTRTFIDEVHNDLFPPTTREIDEWEAQWALPKVGLTDTEARDRLTAIWRATGGQDPEYLQGVMQDAGFNIFIHEWWDETIPTPPYVARNPNLVLSNGTPTFVIACAAPGVDDDSICGEVGAVAGETVSPRGRLLVNPGIGITYIIPVDPVEHHFILYWGGEVFGDFATVPQSRKAELEELLLTYCPAQLWLGLLIDFV